MLNCGEQITTVRLVGRHVEEKKKSPHSCTRPAAVARLNSHVSAYQLTENTRQACRIRGVNQLQPSHTGPNGLLGPCASLLSLVWFR